MPIYLFLISNILIWGLSWPINKMGLNYMPPLWFAGSRLVLGVCTMFLIVTFLGKLIIPQKKDLKIIFSIGTFQVGLLMILVNLGLFFVPAGRASILVFTTPLWIVPLSIFLFKEESTPLKWLGFILGLTGILILFDPLHMNIQDEKEIFGDIILLGAALTWSIGILCARHMTWTRTPLELIPWQLFLGTVLVFIFIMIIQPQSQITWNKTLILSLLYNGILATGIAYWLTVFISKELSPITTSLSLLGVPVIGIISSALMLQEPITYQTIIAMFFIFSGLLCVLIKK